MTVPRSKGYLRAKNKILMIKNGKVNIITPEPITNEEDARRVLRDTLHDMLNEEYMHNHPDGVTESEVEILHDLIEGQPTPEDMIDKDGKLVPRPPEGENNG